jgi:hypothetical protein
MKTKQEIQREEKKVDRVMTMAMCKRCNTVIFCCFASNVGKKLHCVGWDRVSNA